MHFDNFVRDIKKIHLWYHFFFAPFQAFSLIVRRCLPLFFCCAIFYCWTLSVSVPLTGRILKYIFFQKLVIWKPRLFPPVFNSPFSHHSLRLRSLASTSFSTISLDFDIISMLSDINVIQKSYGEYYYDDFLTQVLTSRRIFPWSLGDSKSPQISRTLISALAGLYNAMVWMILILPLGSILPSLLSRFWGTSNNSKFDWYHLHLEVQQFCSFQARSRYLPIFLALFHF